MAKDVKALPAIEGSSGGGTGVPRLEALRRLRTVAGQGCRVR
jgi:hypothetical protein